MPLDVWYYAADNTERGPVGLAELKSLLAAGTISPATLVWQEGMPDWTAAAQVPALCENISAATSTPEPPPPPVAPALPVGTPVPPQLSAFADVRMRGPRASGGARHTLALLMRLIGLPLLFVGLAIVLLARGCDSLSVRYATRLQALSQVAERHFRDEWDSARTDVETKREAAIKRSDSQQAESFTERLKLLNEEKSAEQDRLRQGTWRTLARNARDAEASVNIWAFWRECWYTFGLLMLTLGLVGVGLGSTGGERWFCLAVLAVIVCSLVGPGLTLKLGGG